MSVFRFSTGTGRALGDAGARDSGEVQVRELRNHGHEVPSDQRTLQTQGGVER